MEHDPTWLDWDEQIGPLHNVKVINNEANVELTFKEEWYDEERDNQNEVYFKVTALVRGETLEAQFPQKTSDYLLVHNFFSTLKKNYLLLDPCMTYGIKNFKNQCAIKMGVTLEDSGVDTQSFDIKYPGRRCWHHEDGKRKHILAAEELANWLLSLEGKTFGKLHKFPSAEIFRNPIKHEDIGKRTGVIFIKDYWERELDIQGSPTGDHIDLYDGSSLTNKVLNGRDSGVTRAKEAWFWNI
jgi:hypothetical protein